jgi:hypothetical protein
MTQYNRAARPLYYACIRTVWGGESIYLNKEEAEQYNADPDDYAARHFGISKREYREWIECGGTALCSQRTRAGKLCKNSVGGELQPDKWKRLHRTAVCHCHGGSTEFSS